LDQVLGDVTILREGKREGGELLLVRLVGVEGRTRQVLVKHGQIPATLINARAISDWDLGRVLRAWVVR
jgi:hypothetical protein